MKERWQHLNKREQRLVASLGGVFLLFILYSVIWQPMNDGIAEANEKLVKKRELLTWVNENTASYLQAKRSGGKAKSKGSLSRVVNASAKNYKLTITRMQPQGDDLQVWIDNTSFTQLLFWLEHLANKEGLQVKAIDISKGSSAGEAKIRRLHLARM